MTLEDPDTWVAYVDGSSYELNGAEIILDGRNMEVLITSSISSFAPPTNIQSEQETVIVGLKLALHIKETKIAILSDSKLLVS